MTTNPLTLLTFQTTGIVLVALVLRLLMTGSTGRFLAYWSNAWFALAIALAALGMAHFRSQHLLEWNLDWLRWPVLSAFFLLEYTFGFFIWAGCRRYASGLSLTWADFWRLVVPAFFAVLGPAVAPSLQSLFPFHSGICGFFFLMALLATVAIRPASRLAASGLRLTQAALLGLTILFWWYAIVQERMPAYSRDLYSLHSSPFYDGLVVTFLSFGMVILATDHARRELEERNRQLADLTDQLAIAARTDPLTGLLNRRAFETMLADLANTPFSGSVAVVDVNFLKTLNDQYGHKTGDAAIQNVARALRAHFRITDPIFRLGGDEFLVVLEGGRASELAGRLESVDRVLSSVRLPGVEGSMSVSVAWGMADFERVSDLPEAMERADVEMYRRKAERKTIR